MKSFQPIFKKVRLAVGTAALLATCGAWADIHVGVILSLTGPGASLGIPEEKIIQLWPAELGGQKAKFTILNDNSDTSTAAKNTMRLITEDKVDMIIGSSLTPTSLAVLEAAGAEKVPVISLAGGGAIVLPQEGPRRWAFKLSPTEAISVGRVLEHMNKYKLKTIATQDYCLATQEHELGVEALAVPLRNQRGDTVAALNLVRSGAAPNDPDLASRWLPLLQQTAQALRPLI